MIKKYKKGSFGNIDLGAFGGKAKPYDLDKLSDGFFIGNEYLQTVAGTNKQLKGMKDMLHSLPAPLSMPEIFTPTPNYGKINQQFTDAEANLKSTPILGTSINQHIAQQQALGEQGVALDHQRIQTLANMENSALQQAMEAEQQNALSRYQTAEERRKFDMAIKQQIQDNEDAATAIKVDAIKKMSQEFYSLHKMKEMRENAKKMAEMQRNYNKEKQSVLNKEKLDYDDLIAQEFRDQFTDDYYSMQDSEDFMRKYGVTEEEYLDPSSLYDTEAYKKKFEEYRTSKESDWLAKQNEVLVNFDDDWWRANGDLYWSYKMKNGGKIQNKSQDNSRDKILERLSRKNEKIAVDNNKALRDFVKQMNEKQAKIFLKLMSI